MKPLQVLFIGDDGQPEFQEPLSNLRTTSELHIVEPPTVVCPSAIYDLVIVAQPQASAASQTLIASIRHHVPLAPILFLIGGWAEGETRSATAIPGVLRIHAQNWSLFWREQLDRLRRGLSPIWALPATATDAERVVARSGWQISGSFSAAIQSPDAEMRSLLRRMLALNECRCREVPMDGHELVTPVEVAVWDSAIPDHSAYSALRWFSRLVEPAPVVALVAFARLSQRERFLQCGASAVVAKPFFVDELMAQLHRFAQANLRNGSHDRYDSQSLTSK